MIYFQRVIRLIIKDLNNKKYNIPKNVPKSTKFKYIHIIQRDYSKYLEAISISGGMCMFMQFRKLVNAFYGNNSLADGTIRVYASSIINELEDLGFIGTEYLNKNKYIYLKHTAYALVEGDYKTNKRLRLKTELKIDRFTINITKMEYLIKYRESLSSAIIEEQLTLITKNILDLIIKSGNQYGFDINTIKEIIEMGTYCKVKKILDDSIEANIKLGVIRFLWSELAKELWKLSLQGQTIEATPFHLKLNLLKDGRITIHYAPTIIIFDTSKDLQFYANQSNNYFNIFYRMPGNATQVLKSEYIKNKDFGYPHFNRIGYTIKIIGSFEGKLQSKVDVLNIPYYREDDTNEHTPLVYPCTFRQVEVANYFKEGRSPIKESESFKYANDRIFEFIDKEKDKE